MKVSFICVHRTRETSPVRAKVSYKGNVFFYNTGVSVRPGDFRAGKCAGRSEEVRVANFKLEQVASAMTSALLFYTRNFEVPSQQEFATKVDTFLGGKKATEIVREKKLFLPYMEQKHAAEAVSELTRKTYLTTIGIVTAFQGSRRYTFDQVDQTYYTRLLTWMERKGYSRNYIGATVKNIKKFMAMAWREKLHDNMAFLSFRKQREDADSVYLTMQELDAIHKLRITTELLDTVMPDRHKGDAGMESKIIAGLDRARKKFLIGAVCALRVSDYNRIEKTSIKDGVVTIMPVKGSALRKPEPVTMPLHPIMREIIESGFDPSTYIVPQHLNQQIRTVCRLAGINDPVTTYRTKGGVLVAETKEKWMLVSSHTARRSGATNMHLAGMPDHLIMACTGHTTTKQLYAYIKAKRISDVEDLRNSPYFSEKH